MKEFTAHCAAQAAGASVCGKLPEGELTAVVTDSREVIPGCLFAAIPGASVDGHSFVRQAQEKGAACALCEHPVEGAEPLLLVPDTKRALRQMAAEYRRHFTIPFVGVTGSVGKTTAKEMIKSVLSRRYRTMATEKNYNNDLGVPKTLFRLSESDEAAVVEMGISDFGEMTVLTDMVHPDIAVFTLIGDAHLEKLGDRNGVLRAKGEIVAGMPEKGVLVVNGDDPLLAVHDFGRRKVCFGISENADVRAVNISPEGASATSLDILYGERRVHARVPAYGSHLVSAALAAAAVGFLLGLTDKQIADGIADYQTVGSRGRVLTTGFCTVVDDCYNANPTSAKAAVDSMMALDGRHVCVLGDMLELGPNAPALHDALGAYAAGKGAVVIACGPLSRHTQQGAGEGAVWFSDTAELGAHIKELLLPGDVVLVKASHAMGFEKIVDLLREC